VAATVGSMQFAERLWLIASLRTVSQMAIASVMTTVAVFAAQIAPVGRRAESIGTIGLAGFVGMILGSSLGDEIFADHSGSILAYRVFFAASAVCSLAAGATMLLIALPTQAPAPHAGARIPSRTTSRVILKHWPGSILVIGLVFAMVFCLQLSFLERLAEARGFKDIKVFFLVYGPTAISLRIICRRVPQRIGRTRTLLGGLLLLSSGVLCLVGTQSQDGLVVPGLLMGAGHCFIFPSMVDLAAERLPPEHRGIGTSLILGAGDLGLLIGFGLLGELIDRFGFDTALVVLTATVLSGAIILAWTRREAVFSHQPR
jgi:predicted MFS family arabinose efflux permease